MPELSARTRDSWRIDMTTQEAKSKTPSPRPKRRWKRVIVLFAVVAAASVARPVWHLLSTIWNDRDEIEAVLPGEINDASRLNRTPVAEVIDVPLEPDRAEEQLSELLSRARRDGLRVSIAGARHSMGGHTIYPGGISVNMLPHNQMTLEEEREILHVGAGALWSDIIPFLDKRGRSVAVM